jgi:hypothetical protein
MEGISPGLSFRHLLSDNHTHFSVPEAGKSASHVARATKIYAS